LKIAIKIPFTSFFIFAILLACTSEVEINKISITTVNTTQQPLNEPTTERTFLALGDSYTIGESVDEKDRWSMIMIDQLKNDIKFTKHTIIATTGWTTEDLQTAIKQKKLTEQFDIVSLLIGVNNQYRGQSVEKYRKEFRELLATATTFAKNDKKRVMVLSIPDWGVTPFAKGLETGKIASEINTFNAVAAEECKNAGIVFINITDDTRFYTDASMYAKDGLHFSGKMHYYWATKAAKIAQEILK
jgi:lysophospholipase L1-like esterase